MRGWRGGGEDYELFVRSLRSVERAELQGRSVSPTFLRSLENVRYDLLIIEVTHVKYEDLLACNCKAEDCHIEDIISWFLSPYN